MYGLSKRLFKKNVINEPSHYICFVVFVNNQTEASLIISLVFFINLIKELETKLKISFLVQVGKVMICKSTPHYYKYKYFEKTNANFSDGKNMLKCF